MNDFLTWEILATYGGALAAVGILTQFTKNLKFVTKIPTQIWSYILALGVLYPAQFFTGQLTNQNAALTFFNGVIISLAANGGFSLVERLKISNKDTDDSQR